MSTLDNMERLERSQTRFAILRDAVLARLPEQFARYEERYGLHPEVELGVRDIFRNGAHIRRDYTSKLIPTSPARFIEKEYVPDFAVGGCVDISDGDYKTVMIDQDGKSDYVIKRFDFANVYRGDGAKRKAEKAAAKIAGIYQVVDETSGFHILPNTVFVAPYSRAYPHDFTVYEKQQRGIFVNHWAFFTPKEAQKIDRQIKKGYERYNKVTMPELLKTGLVTPSYFYSNMIEEHLSLYVAWDIVSNQLVARDVVDAVFV